MNTENEYKILFTKLKEAVKEQKEKFNYSLDYQPFENDQIRELSEICNQLEEESASEEYNSFTRS